MSAEQNLQIVQGMYAAFGRGDLGFVLEHVAPELSWGVCSDTKSLAPWHFECRTRAQVAEYFAVLNQHVEHTVFEARDFAAAGDDVYTTVRMHQRSRKTGETLEQNEVVHHFTFKNGLVVRCRISEDTKKSHEFFAKIR